jgi:prepilin-type N-terminal cleavage/methylation domain-containing protein
MPVAKSSSREVGQVDAGRLKATPTCGGRSDRGFSLVEVLVATLLMTTAFVAMAQLLGISTVMHTDARQASTATQLAQAKIDELMKLNMTTDAAVQVTGSNSLIADVANYFDGPQAGITRRWRVEAGPTADTRILRVRVINRGARQYGSQIELTTLLRQW